MSNTMHPTVAPAITPVDAPSSLLWESVHVDSSNVLLSLQPESKPSEHICIAISMPLFFLNKSAINLNYPLVSI